MITVRIPVPNECHHLWWPLCTPKFRELMLDRGIVWGTEITPDLSIVLPGERAHGKKIVADLIDEASVSVPARHAASLGGAVGFMKPASYASSCDGMPIHVVNTAFWWLCHMRPSLLDETDHRKTLDFSLVASSRFVDKLGRDVLGATKHRNDAFIACMDACIGRNAIVCRRHHADQKVYTDTDVYLSIMKASKVVVCPWGISEWTMREWEARMLNCAVVAPRYPVPYDTSPWVIEPTEWCNPDFSDLTEAIDKALATYQSLNSARHYIGEIHREYGSSWSQLALLVEDMVKQAA